MRSGAEHSQCFHHFFGPLFALDTSSAKRGQIELDFSDHDVVAAIQALTVKDFYKSMPPVHENFVAWQDVYKTFFNDIDLYIKFQISVNRELIISFKEK